MSFGFPSTRCAALAWCSSVLGSWDEDGQNSEPTAIEVCGHVLRRLSPHWFALMLRCPPVLTTTSSSATASYVLIFLYQTLKSVQLCLRATYFALYWHSEEYDTASMADLWVLAPFSGSG